MFCTKCGKQVEGNTEFCTHCGAQRAVTSPDKPKKSNDSNSAWFAFIGVGVWVCAYLIWELQN